MSAAATTRTIEIPGHRASFRMQNFDWLLGCFSGHTFPLVFNLSKRTSPSPHELSKINKTFENINNISLQETHIDFGMLESQARQTKSYEQNGVASPATRLDIGLKAKTHERSPHHSPDRSLVPRKMCTIGS